MPAGQSKNSRALIIAIESYASAQCGLTRRLEGTHAAAVKFREWLIREHGMPAENIIFCAESADIPGRTHGATATEISKAVYSLWQSGKGRTSELHFYFSGHGFLYEESEARNEVADILVCAEFVDPDFSGNACRKLPEIQQHLRISMGPGDHFYFINACRNKMKEGDIAPGALGLRPQRATNGDANPFALYSTQPGAFANANNRFSNFLVDGLKGDGIAMTWDNSDLVVSFSSLERFLKARLSDQEVDGRPGRGPGIIRKIDPIPKFVCTVEVIGAKAGEKFKVRGETGRGQPVQLFPDLFSGPRFDLPPMIPDKYTFSVSRGGIDLRPEMSAAVELFGPRTIRFQLAGELEEAPSADSAGTASVTIVSVPAADIRVRDLLSGSETICSLSDRGQASRRFTPGRYAFSLNTPGGELLKLRELRLEAGEGRTVSVKPTSRRPLKQVIKSRFGLHDGHLDFSESLGAIPDQDLAVWLSILGASRIMGGPSEYSKLSPLPLARFDLARQGDAPIYILAALRGIDGPLRFARSEDGVPLKWVRAAAVQRLPGLRQLVLETSPGRQLLSYAKSGGSSRTVVSHTLPNRATLVTISDTQSELRIHQYILPIWNLRAHLPPRTRDAMAYRPLQRVVEIARAQGRYGRQQKMAPEGEGSQFWDGLLYEKWLDPLTAVLAAYELVRRGRLDSMPTVVGNLRRHFAGLPDTEILARLAGLAAAQDPGVPLVLDGLLSQEETKGLPLPEAFLDYGGIWTSWRGAVQVGKP